MNTRISPKTDRKIIISPKLKDLVLCGLVQDPRIVSLDNSGLEKIFIEEGIFHAD